jgi:ParB family transcriptional regulator, chromosome partitioning protein
MAHRTGKDRSSVANYLRLLRLPEPVQNLVETNQLTFGHAKALMGLDTPEAIVSLAERVVQKSLSVRQTEDAVADWLHPVKEIERKIKALTIDPNVREAEKELERALGVRVTITDRKGKGKILLQYSSLEDFDRILSALAHK